MITTKKKDNLLEWFVETLKKSEFIEETSVPGSIVHMENLVSVWEQIQKFLDCELKSMGYNNMYFPLFIPESLMKKEKEHYRVFSSELARITHIGEKKLKESLVIRPTSEIIMYDSIKKSLDHHHKLPFLLNQFCSVVRWETRKKNVPLLRGNEFLWQESHSAHTTEKEMRSFVKKILRLYKILMINQLALPYFEGFKPGHRKFPGAIETFALESIMPDGKSVQMATSHDLGQTFSKALKIKFTNNKGKKELVWQSSNGCTTRLVGGLLMMHGDDYGFVLPPNIAGHQIVFLNNTEKKLIDKLNSNGIRARAIGWRGLNAQEKHSFGLVKGFPLIVLRESEGNLVILRRDTLQELTVSKSGLVDFAKKELNKIQQILLKNALKMTKAKTFSPKSKKEFEERLLNNEGMVLANWCGNRQCSRNIKEKTRGSLRIVPNKKASGKCIYCTKKARHKAFFAEAY